MRDDVEVYDEDEYALEVPEADEPLDIDVPVNTPDTPKDDKRIRKTVLYFRDRGIVMPVSALQTMGKDMRFIEAPHAHWEFGIIINAGLLPPSGETALWYSDEMTRDTRWDEILDTLKKEGLNIVTL